MKSKTFFFFPFFLFSNAASYFLHMGLPGVFQGRKFPEVFLS